MEANLQESDFIEKNKRKLDTLSTKVFSHPVSACALLESVSLFEMVGSKWMLAVEHKFWDDQIHEHCFDEVIHTKLVLEEAKKIRWDLNETDLVKENNLTKIAYKAVDRYLNKLSKKVFKLTLSHGVDNADFALSAYSLLSFVIERRIMTIYPHLEQFGPTESVQKTAKRILSDERKHLHFVGDHLPTGLLKASINIDELVVMEEELAQSWIGIFNRECKNL